MLISPELLEEHLGKITGILSRMLDVDIFPWLAEKRRPTTEERYRSSTIVADRLCGAVAEPIVRNAQEKRQLALIEKYLTERGYKLKAHPMPPRRSTQMEPGTFCFPAQCACKTLSGGSQDCQNPDRCGVQPKKAKLPHLPMLIEAKSAGDFTNVNKRRKEEATKINQLKATYGDQVVFVLFLVRVFRCGLSGL